MHAGELDLSLHSLPCMQAAIAAAGIVGLAVGGGSDAGLG